MAVRYAHILKGGNCRGDKPWSPAVCMTSSYGGAVVLLCCLTAIIQTCIWIVWEDKFWHPRCSCWISLGIPVLESSYSDHTFQLLLLEVKLFLWNSSINILKWHRFHQVREIKLLLCNTRKSYFALMMSLPSVWFWLSSLFLLSLNCFREVLPACGTRFKWFAKVFTNRKKCLCPSQQSYI